ncbi:MAG: hypothetical protein Q8Q14_12855, partial [Gemmatimonadales bacterium]|nr:hypothetical protein [Gemmatimonadales bacterium]
CGGDSTGPSAASVTGVAGDSQIGPTGALLDVPLSFVALGSGGAPVEGVTVTWSVQSGSAFVSPINTSTNGSGVAATTVTLGGVIGDVEIRGTVAGLAQPVMFHALVVDPCTFARELTFGSAFSAVLATLDCNLGGWYYDFYVFSVGSQQAVTISSASTAIDTWLDLFGSQGYFAVNDDIVRTQNTNSRIHAILAPGDYLVGANSFSQGETGAYTILGATRGQALTACEEMFVTFGVTLADGIATTDCVDAGPTYSDRVRIVGEPGAVLRFTQRSAAVDPVITLYSVRVAQDFSDSLVFVSSNDDSTGTTTDAFLEHTVTQLDMFEVRFGTAVAGETGAYTASIGGTPAPGAPAATGRPRLGGRRLPLRSKPLPVRRGTH